ncbi:hypothetical protein D3C76_1598130 [compost metagenome]
MHILILDDMRCSTTRNEKVYRLRVSETAQFTAHFKSDNTAQTMSKHRIWTAVEMWNQRMLNIFHYLIYRSQQRLTETSSSPRKLDSD